MYKRIFAGIGIAGVLVASGALLAQPAAALTIDEIQAQIKVLLSKVADLQAQLRLVNTTPSVVVESSPDSNIATKKHRICDNLFNRNLTPGAQGDDVRGLQEFLSTEGYLSASATGYFGPMTAQAVAKWQTSQGVSAVGNFGPRSRERIKIWCGGGGNQERFSASPQRGTAPLTVHFWYSLGGDSSVGYTVDFGDGTTVAPVIGCAIDPSLQVGACPRGLTASHTYTANGTYTAILYQNNKGGCTPEAEAQGCLGPPASRIAVAKLQIHVGPQPVGCTKEYMPVCGSKPIVCITTPCNPIQQTYSNRCNMNADGATFLYEGACRTTTVNPADDPQCKSWFDGCNTCSRQSPSSPAMCTMMACVMGYPSGQEPRPYCKAYFDNNSTNKPPVISGLSGPTTLSVYQVGTWTIRASDPEQGQLSYSVTWGDENATGAAPSSDGLDLYSAQSSTFTHSYASAGTYTVTVVVRDSAGKEARTSSTVRVGTTALCPLVPVVDCMPGTYIVSGGNDSNGCQLPDKCVASTGCTREYIPVCGYLSGCKPCSGPPGTACAAICELNTKTFSNRCNMNSAGATYLHAGECNANSGGSGNISN